ncbi:MAG TPA: sigma-70 family RNA polymerase sigma factor [Urbifossiella sp.]|nr:sigma-70 family RNA polymerase sigma factor [Urbifossiella sp.]
MKRLGPNLLHSLLAGPPAGDPVPDGDLLARFIRGDSAAFELLVRRHAEAVYATCGRVCADTHDAEDAFQAVFLILARKAAGVRRAGSLAGWLHRVAHRAATRAAVRRARTGRRERAITTDLPAKASPEDPVELRAVLDGEIDRLGERFRLPVILCYLQGVSTDDAATRLGIPRGTVLSRLAAARKALAARLARRGITAPLAVVGLAGTDPVASAALVAAATRAGTGVLTQTTAGVLAREVLQMIALKTTVTWAAAALVTVAGLGGWAVTAGGGERLVAAAPDDTPAPGAAKGAGGVVPPAAGKSASDVAWAKLLEVDAWSWVEKGAPAPTEPWEKLYKAARDASHPDTEAGQVAYLRQLQRALDARPPRAGRLVVRNAIGDAMVLNFSRRMPDEAAAWYAQTVDQFKDLAASNDVMLAHLRLAEGLNNRKDRETFRPVYTRLLRGVIETPGAAILVTDDGRFLTLAHARKTGYPAAERQRMAAAGAPPDNLDQLDAEYGRRLVKDGEERFAELRQAAAGILARAQYVEGDFAATRVNLLRLRQYRPDDEVVQAPAVAYLRDVEAAEAARRRAKP